MVKSYIQYILHHQLIYNQENQMYNPSNFITLPKPEADLLERFKARTNQHGKRRQMMYLSDDVRDILKALGGGNMSKGLRRATYGLQDTIELIELFTPEEIAQAQQRQSKNTTTSEQTYPHPTPITDEPLDAHPRTGAQTNCVIRATSPDPITPTPNLQPDEEEDEEELHTWVDLPTPPPIPG